MDNDDNSHDTDTDTDTEHQAHQTGDAPLSDITKDAGDRIVVGVDGSAASAAAVTWALGQAALTGAPVELVAAWQYPNTWGMEFVEMDNDWAGLARTTLDEMATASRSDASDTTRAAVAMTTTAIQGHPAEVLVEASKASSLLVVGSRGHGGFVGMLLGSTSEYVIAHAHCPVLVVRAPD